MPNPNHPVAYLSLEIGLDPALPTYSGGLGVLAGDTIRAAADLELPFAAVTLLYRAGYFTQTIDASGMQHESPTDWNPEELLEEMPQRVYVPIEGRTVSVRAFRRMVRGVTGGHVPVYFLDTDLPENDPRDRAITRSLYAGDQDHRVRQAAVLGIAGRRMLRAATHDCVTFHLNEGHGFLVTIELMSEFLARHGLMEVTPAAIEYVRRQCVFTTHTPIEAGHDKFDINRVRAIVGDHPLFARPDLTGGEGTLNTTVLALNLSRYANGVARKHGEVSRAMFPGYHIDSVTNGVHAATWMGTAMAQVMDRHLPQWRRSTSDLRLAGGIPIAELHQAHTHQKHAMIDAVNNAGPTATVSPDPFTIVFARRSTAYKRPHLVFHDPARLRAIAERSGGLQIIFGGKAHPHDGRGKELLQRVVDIGKSLGDAVRVAVVPNYGMALAKHLVAGADLWLNTPEPPLEASGTSGMKAALNGVPSLSTADGWWLEGAVEGVTGWTIQGEGTGDALVAAHAASLYDTLERDILPAHADPERWGGIMRSAISINGSYFTTQRMVRDYVMRAYLD